MVQLSLSAASAKLAPYTQHLYRVHRISALSKQWSSQQAVQSCCHTLINAAQDACVKTIQAIHQVIWKQTTKTANDKQALENRRDPESSQHSEPFRVAPRDTLKTQGTSCVKHDHLCGRTRFNHLNACFPGRQAVDWVQQDAMLLGHLQMHTLPMASSCAIVMHQSCFTM